ncbi:MAG TPA: N-acetylmuramoyl-L-alanine amidase, partial [Bauldia sp.]|nr:N-acetylmuramoyl-L-alanine amidase [Bauldia sp.]
AGAPGRAAAQEATVASAAADAPRVTAARILGDAKRARFIADMTGGVDVVVFTLADPYRIVIDLPEVRFDLPADTAPVKIDKSFVIQATPGQPARLVIDVVPTTRAAFLEAGRAYREAQEVAAAAARERAFVPGPRPASGKRVVVLDPGHGGIDTGAKGVAGGIEKDVTLAFSRILGEKLVATGLYEIYYTRTDDSFVGLVDRVLFAREHGADLFVSLHANSFRGRSIRGATIYTVADGASDAMAAEIAQNENQSDLLAGVDLPEEDSDDVRDILLDLTKRETRNFGVVLAKNIIKEMRSSTLMFKVPHQRAGFKVLEAPDVPSAMIELGFMSNPEDEKLLLSDAWRQKTADAVVRAVAAYFSTKGTPGGTQ